MIGCEISFNFCESPESLDSKSTGFFLESPKQAQHLSSMDWLLACPCRCLGVWMFGCLGVLVSGCLDVWVSACVGVWVSGVSGCLGVWMFGCLGVWVSGCLGVWMFGCLGVWVSGCLGVSGGRGAWVVSRLSRITYIYFFFYL